LERQILLQNSVLHIFRNPGTYYLQFLDLQNKRYEFTKLTKVFDVI
jgi:hypothetical protein